MRSEHADKTEQKILIGVTHEFITIARSIEFPELPEIYSFI